MRARLLNDWNHTYSILKYLIRLGLCIDWASFEQLLGATYPPTQGAPGIRTRLMVALHYLKYQHDLSDENVLLRWVENPYW
jgi:IS5 family transposase